MTTDTAFAEPVLQADDMAAHYAATELAEHLYVLARLNMAPASNARAIIYHASEVQALLTQITAHVFA